LSRSKKTLSATASAVLDRFGLGGCKFPPLIDAFHGESLLIVGSGRSVWEETNGLPEQRHVMAVNDMGMYWPGYVTHWYSNDIDKLVHWSQGRRDRHVHRYGWGWKLHSCFTRDNLPLDVHHWPLPGQGSSGLVAILVALLLGYEPITVAGIPLDNSGHFFDPPNHHNLRKDGDWSNFLGEATDRLIERSLPLMRGRVRVLSGRLAEALG
jgi:hypothetical protein